MTVAARWLNINGAEARRRAQTEHLNRADPSKPGLTLTEQSI